MSSDARRTRRVRDESEGLGLDEHIQRRRTELVRAREEIPVLEEQIRRFREAAQAMTNRWQTRMRCDTLRRAEQLEREAEVRRSMVREHAFETTVVTYLRRYYERRPDVPCPRKTVRKSDTIQAYVHQTDTNQQHRSSIVDEYLTEMQRAPAKVAMTTRDNCPRCANAPQLLLCSARSIMSCPTCGYSVTYLDATSTSTSFDELVEFSQYSYKRVNHYMMWLTLLQGKETHRVPDSILSAVAEDLYDRVGLRSTEDVTQKRVRESLRHLKLRRAYDHVAQVAARLSGKRPVRISPQIEEQLRNMFLRMQPAFQRHAPKSRTNFLSYSYVLYRCFQILGIPEMLGGISLLKGRDKLEANDAIFRKMCVDLGWPIFDLPPASETTGQ